MASFTTRVELHTAKSEDYDKLHEYMEKEGFIRTITTDDNITYQLPSAEYIISGNYTRSQTLQKAKAASAKTNKTCSILVTQAEGWSWSGLDQV
jgi:hypothetical protein